MGAIERCSVPRPGRGGGGRSADGVHWGVRAWLPLLLVLFVPTTGCATVISALIGEAVCGDSDECRSDLVSSGIEADVAVVASAIEEAAASDDSPPRTRAYEGGAISSGGEEYDPPEETSGYYHCVDDDGHHVIELVAPSAQDARLLCAAQLGVTWTAPEAGELCSCTSRG